MPVSAVRVKALSSASVVDRPLSFSLRGEERRIQRVVSRARRPDSLHFVIIDEKGQAFHLCYHLLSADWQIYPIYVEGATP